MVFNHSIMRAVMFDGELKFVRDYPVPEVPPRWARIRVQKAGICKTDMELMKGYEDFKGILGHEFIGKVDQCDDDLNWMDKRVTGEINVACGQCDWGARDLGRHCPNRMVLGILNHDGCMADYCVLPIVNLVELPSALPDDRAILIEPLSAACEILEQLELNGSERAVVLGDGRLGTLCAWALATIVSDVTIVGRHAKKLELAKWRELKTAIGSDNVAHGADIIVEATGSDSGINEAMSICRPRGTIVLKSTIAFQSGLNLAPIVVNELTVIGSRCGRFKDGLRMLQSYPDMPIERLITARYPVEQSAEAFKRATQPDALKVLLEISE